MSDDHEDLLARKSGMQAKLRELFDSTANGWRHSDFASQYTARMNVMELAYQIEEIDRQLGPSTGS